MNEQELAVGIDLGTTFSAVAHLDDLGRPQTMINAEGDTITPSVVLIDGVDVVVGKEAVKAMATENESVAECACDTVVSWLRELIGSCWKSDMVASWFPDAVALWLVEATGS